MFGKHASLGDFLTRRQRKKARFHAPLGWGTWIRTRECRNQNPVPYRLAIPQYHRYDS